MKCDKCEKEAVVHEIVPTENGLVEKHLCEVHASEAGIQVSQDAPVHELFKIALGSGSGTTRQVLACSGCGTSYSEFQKTGLLGCAGCYRTFESKLGPLLERAHEGALHHVGKVPKRALDSERDQARDGGPSPLTIEDRARLLKARLEQAVHKEDYEQAAKLRDELADLGDEPEA